jgi:hypothetical protein
MNDVASCQLVAMAPPRSRREARLALRALPLIALSAGSCGGATGDGTGGGGGFNAAPVPLTEACEVYKADLCRALVTCVPLAGYRTIADCLAEEECLGGETLLAVVAGGSVEYSPEGAGRCHAMANADICAFADRFGARPAIWETLSACPGALVNKRGRGATCEEDYHCAPGTVCWHPSGTCGGVCEPGRKVGESCDDNTARCSAGLACASDGCHPRPARAGDICWANNQCRTEELYCDTATRTCRRRPGEGEPCGGTFRDCATGTNCTGSGGGLPTCARAPAIGERCHFQANPCQPGLFCAHNDGVEKPGVCFQYGAAGMSCRGPGGVACAPDLVCQADGICAPPHGLGASCRYHPDCARGLRCEAGACTDRGAIGLACDATNACLAGLCRGGTCQPRARIGEPCTAGDDCRTKQCERGACTGPSGCGGR